MNIEYVYLILLGINTYIDQNARYDKICITNCNQLSKIKLERLYIKNTKKWNVNDTHSALPSTVIDLGTRSRLTMDELTIAEQTT